MKFSPQQEQFIKLIKPWLSDPNAPQVFYLAGFAGTGKTTLARLIKELVGSVVYAAFTGKAALVLSSKGCSPSSTIHSLIYKAQGSQWGGVMLFDESWGYPFRGIEKNGSTRA